MPAKDAIKYPLVEGVSMALEQLEGENVPEAADADPTQFIHGELVKKLDESGFIDSFYK